MLLPGRPACPIANIASSGSFVKNHPLHDGKLQTDLKGMVHLGQQFPVQMTDFVLQPFLVDGAKLLQKNDRILHNIVFRRINLNMCRQFRLIHFRCNGCADDRGTVFVSHIILNNQHRADSSLFTAYYRPQVRIKNIPSSNYHSIHTPIPFIAIRPSYLIVFPDFFCVYMSSRKNAS